MAKQTANIIEGCGSMSHLHTSVSSIPIYIGQAFARCFDNNVPDSYVEERHNGLNKAVNKEKPITQAIGKDFERMRERFGGE